MLLLANLAESTTSLLALLTLLLVSHFESDTLLYN